MLVDFIVTVGVRAEVFEFVSERARYLYGRIVIWHAIDLR
jgi:hypothetical protein